MSKNSKLVELFQSVEQLSQSELDMLFQYLKAYMRVTIDRLADADEQLEIDKISQDYLFELESLSKLFSENLHDNKLTVAQYSCFVEVMFNMSLGLLDLENTKKMDEIPVEKMVAINKMVLQAFNHLCELNVISYKEAICKELFLGWKHFRHLLHRINNRCYPADYTKKIKKQSDSFMALLDSSEEIYRRANEAEFERRESHLKFQMNLIRHFSWLKPLYNRVMTHIKNETFALRHPFFVDFVE